MTATWEIETQIIPQFFDKNRGFILESLLLKGCDFICDNFNRAFETYFENGDLNQKIKYAPNEFYVTVKAYDDTHRIIYIELPKPRKSDFTYDFYVKSYFIPYCINENGIKIFDLFGIDTINDTNIGFIVRYIDAQHMISNLRLPISPHNRADIIKFMSKYIFERI